MSTKHTATFASGAVLTRTSKDRVYTHAWKATWTNRTDAEVTEHRRGVQSGMTGFAGSYELARSAAASALADSKYGKHPGDRATMKSEIVETVRTQKGK